MAIAALAPYGRNQWFTSSGVPLSGGKLYTYINTTTTNQTTYSDANGTTPNANPIILDSAGRASVYLGSGLVYTFVLKDSTDVTIWTQDGVFNPDAAYIGGLVTTAAAGIVLPVASTVLSGIAELATGAETAALTDATRTVTPLGLASLFTKDLVGGEITINGLVVKWGTKTVSDYGNNAAANNVTGSITDTTVTFTTAFPTACDGLLVTAQGDNGTPGYESNEHTFSVQAGTNVTSATVRAYRLTGTSTGADSFKFFWVAVGR